MKMNMMMMMMIMTMIMIKSEGHAMVKRTIKLKTS